MSHQTALYLAEASIGNNAAGQKSILQQSATEVLPDLSATFFCNAARPDDADE
jgi:hypothetical protein